MKTVLYYDCVRNKKTFLQNLLTWVVLFLVVFLISFIVEKVVPNFNSEYLKWPDMAKDFLAIGSWNRHVYVNVWYIFALIFPVYMVYVLMNGLTESVVQEERLETMVYLQNLSVGRAGVMFSKLLFWTGYAFVMLFVLFIENVLFFVVLGNQLNISMLVQYYGTLLLSCFIYLALALFLSSYFQNENACNEKITNILLFSIIISKLGAFVHLLTDLMIIRGQEGSILDKVEMVADKLDVLIVLCPVAWSWVGVDVSDLYLACGVIVAVFMIAGAFWVYMSRGKGEPSTK